MRTRTLKAANTWDAMDEAFRFLNDRRVRENMPAGVYARHCILETRTAEDAVKSYRCTRCGAEFHLVRAAEHKFQVRAGAHSLHSDEDCAEGFAKKEHAS